MHNVCNIVQGNKNCKRMRFHQFSLLVCSLKGHRKVWKSWGEGRGAWSAPPDWDRIVTDLPKSPLSPSSDGSVLIYLFVLKPLVQKLPHNKKLKQFIPNLPLLAIVVPCIIIRDISVTSVEFSGRESTRSRF